jgi:predicted ABC-type ATPase
MITRFRDLLKTNKSFAFETTGAGINYVKHLQEAQSNGYEVHLIPSPEVAINRVAQRVVQGGHHIPEDTIIRRYYAGLKNLIRHYLPLSDSALILDNSIVENRVIARKYIIDLDFVHFLDPSSERCFIQLNKFLGRGRNTPSCEIYYAVFCLSREYGSKKCTKSRLMA